MNLKNLKQEELLKETLKKIDIIICTALIPGREAPKIIKEGNVSKFTTRFSDL